MRQLRKPERRPEEDGFGPPLTLDEIPSMPAKKGRSTWRTGGESVNAEESAVLVSLSCGSQCGGKYVREYLPGASYRCQKCKSDTVEKLSMSGGFQIEQTLLSTAWNCVGLCMTASSDKLPFRQFARLIFRKQGTQCIRAEIKINTC